MSPEELAYSEAVRSIEQQARLLDELRSRAGVLLTGASIAGSLFGVGAVGKTNFDLLAALAVLSFCCVLALTLAILWPRGEWRWALGATVLLEDWVDEPRCGDAPAMTRFIAQTIEANWRTNQDRLDHMMVLFQIAGAALGLEVIFWTLKLA